MAGKRQHFLPRLLLKGFASKTVGDETYSFQFRKDSETLELNIKNVGLEGYFFQHGDDSSLDDTYTELETTKFDPLVASMRASGVVPMGSDESIAELITNLTVRTRNVRLGLHGAMERLEKVCRENLDTPERILHWAEHTVRTNPDALIEKVAEAYPAVREHKDNPAMRQVVVEHLIPLLRAELQGHANKMATQLLEALQQQIDKERIKGHHLESLTKTPMPPKRVEQLRGFCWRLVSVPSSTAVLGDVGPVRRLERDRAFQSLLSHEDEPQAVFLPLSPSQILVGEHQELRQRSFSVEDLNQGMARCSVEFFVSCRSTRKESRYAQVIGENAQLLTDEQVRDFEVNFFGRS